MGTIRDGGGLGGVVVPFALQFGNDGLMLDETHGGGEIIKIPGKAAVVEVDDAEPILVHEQVGEAKVSVDEAKSMTLDTVGIEGFGKPVGDPLQKSLVGFLQSQPGAPIPP